MAVLFACTLEKDYPTTLEFTYHKYTYKERTHDQVITAAERTIGISPFSSTFDMVASIPVDYICIVY